MSEKKRKNQKKQWIIGFCGLLVIGAAGGMLAAKMTAAPSDTEKTTKDTVGQDSEEDDSLTDTITWKGEKYQYNDHLSNFLFLGIDKREKTDTNVGHADAGQSDALYLLSWDRKENTITTISIPRDTITEVEAYGPGGESLGTSQDHISLAYAYGDGSYKSGELAKEAVSTLFYGLNIQGYCAINLDALSILSDSVGGVTVTVPNDSLEEKYPELGNLMPRDVIAREEWLQMKQGKQVYLDMSHLDKEIYEKRLKGVIDDCIRFLALDPRKESIILWAVYGWMRTIVHL